MGLLRPNYRYGHGHITLPIPYLQATVTTNVLNKILKYSSNCWA